MFVVAAELHGDKVATHSLLHLRAVCGLRPEYWTCGMFEGSSRGQSRHL